MEILKSGRMIFALALATMTMAAQPCDAGTFSKKTVFAGTYLMGMESIAEFDAFNLLYPGYADDCGFTFYKNGKVEIYDEVGGWESGTYNRFGLNNARITVVLTSVQSPWGAVTYEFYRVGKTNQWWGEIRNDGDVWGHFRGALE